MKRSIVGIAALISSIITALMAILLLTMVLVSRYADADSLWYVWVKLQASDGTIKDGIISDGYISKEVCEAASVDTADYLRSLYFIILDMECIRQ